MKATAFSHEYETYTGTRARAKAPMVTSRRAMLRSALRRDADPEPMVAATAELRRPDHRSGSLEKLYGKSAPERLARMQAELAEVGQAPDHAPATSG
jgi:hypothetical protein